MKYELPEGHGLSDSIISRLVFKEGNKPALSDLQYESLRQGVGRGESALIVSPTSTGKTQVALWAIARSIQSGGNAVYLITQAALARRKFDDFKSLLLPDFLANRGHRLVVATDNYVGNADGDTPAEPLRASLLVATYEKYLALVSTSGVPAGMKDHAIVCDELQLIGDKHRGQNIEALLALMRSIGWKQFVGLSALLDLKDAEDLAGWLAVKLVVQNNREKHLRYECWTPGGIAAVTSERPEAVEEGVALPPDVALDPLSLLAFLLKQENPPVPIVVFCTRRKQDTYDLAQRFLVTHAKTERKQPAPAFEGIPETSANVFLKKALAKRIAILNADLMEEERYVVEQHLLDGKLDVVFASSMPTAGMNFPLGAAIFADWDRWDAAKRAYVPIDSAEFHDMADRVGRLGFRHERGCIIFFAKDETIVPVARRYLSLGAMPALEPRMTPEAFDQLSLQFLASSVCRSKHEVERLVCTALSGQHEQSRNGEQFAKWPALLSASIDGLLHEGLLMQTGSGELVATPAGRAVAGSGLLPETALFLLHCSASKLDRLAMFLPASNNRGDIPRLAFMLLSACFSAPEFRTSSGKRPKRFLPWSLDESILSDAEAYYDDLLEPAWQTDLLPNDAAKLSLDWAEGMEIAALETSIPRLSAGMLREMFRSLVWVLQGFASILAAASDPGTPLPCRPKALRGTELRLDLLRSLSRIARRLSLRVAKGLPDDVLWISELGTSDSAFALSRSEILDLRRLGCVTPEQVMLAASKADPAFLNTLAKTKARAQAKANWLGNASRDWKVIRRERVAEKHLKRAQRCPNTTLIHEYYDSKQIPFEDAFEKVLAVVNVPFRRLDDRTKTGTPQYLLSLKDSPPLIVEITSGARDKLVSYNQAVEVLAASVIYGHPDTFCVALCQPGVDPSVPIAIASSGRLSVVEISDLGEALLRLCEGTLTQNQLWQWLAAPGQALASDLPFRQY
jgi:helicase